MHKIVGAEKGSGWRSLGVGIVHWRNIAPVGLSPVVSEFLRAVPNTKLNNSSALGS